MQNITAPAGFVQLSCGEIWNAMNRVGFFTILCANLPGGNKWSAHQNHCQRMGTFGAGYLIRRRTGCGVSLWCQCLRLLPGESAHGSVSNVWIGGFAWLWSQPFGERGLQVAQYPEQQCGNEQSPSESRTVKQTEEIFFPWEKVVHIYHRIPQQNRNGEN